jgi:hypothetical protein
MVEPTATKFVETATPLPEPARTPLWSSMVTNTMLGATALYTLSAVDAPLTSVAIRPKYAKAPTDANARISSGMAVYRIGGSAHHSELRGQRSRMRLAFREHPTNGTGIRFALPERYPVGKQKRPTYR